VYQSFPAPYVLEMFRAFSLIMGRLISFKKAAIVTRLQTLGLSLSCFKPLKLLHSREYYKSKSVVFDNAVNSLFLREWEAQNFALWGDKILVFFINFGLSSWVSAETKKVKPS
jgi:hypothetical protein